MIIVHVLLIECFEIAPNQECLDRLHQYETFEIIHASCACALWYCMYFNRMF